MEVAEKKSSMTTILAEAGIEVEATEIIQCLVDPYKVGEVVKCARKHFLNGYEVADILSITGDNIRHFCAVAEMSRKWHISTLYMGELMEDTSFSEKDMESVLKKSKEIHMEIEDLVYVTWHFSGEIGIILRALDEIGSGEDIAGVIERGKKAYVYKGLKRKKGSHARRAIRP